MRFGDALLATKFGGSIERDNCLRVFDEHNAAVQRVVPPERLLVFRVTEGWEPLCRFLGCAVPAGIPFPHLNEGDQTIRATARRLFVEPWARRTALTAVVLALLVWWLR